jgi:hypothetical protein
MAPPRKRPRTPHEGVEFKLRVPDSIAKKIEARAKQEQRPMNRIVVNWLGEHERLEQFENFAELLRDLDVIVAQYGAEITRHKLTKELLAAVDTVLEGGAEKQAIDRLRAARITMRRHEESETKGK